MNHEATLVRPRPRSLLRNAVLRRLQGLPIAIEDAAGRVELGAAGPTIRVHDMAFYRRLVFGGHLGAAEAYMDGAWTCDDLTGLVRVLVKNRRHLQGLEGGWARLARPVRALAHWLRRNTRRNSRRNIADHYDLGNDFFELFLDETMMYSCALFERPGMSLKEAQVAKLDRICQRLGLTADDHVLEIGTGWGGFARHAAKHYGCRVTTTTISQEQLEKARGLLQHERLTDRVELLLLDYRDLQGRYDKIVSIEMIEAVGDRFYETYFAACDRLLKPGGRMLLQAITVPDKHYDECRREVDFIKRFVFPGSCIPSVQRLLSAMAGASDLRLVGLDDLTADYAETLRRWRDNFQAHREQIRALGYSERFCRMWEFYLCYCEGGFAERFTGDVHMLLEKCATS